MDQLMQNGRALAVEEDGSEVVEYALIIALVSIVLALALGSSTTGLQAAFTALAGRVSNCFSGTGTC